MIIAQLNKVIIMGLQMSYGGGRSCIGATPKSIIGTLKRISHGSPFALDITALNAHPQLLQMFKSALDSHKVNGGHANTVFKVSTDGSSVCFSSSLSKIDISPDELSPDLYQSISSAKAAIGEKAVGSVGLFQITQTDEL